MPDSFGRHLRRITRELATRLTQIFGKVYSLLYWALTLFDEALQSLRIATEMLADTTA